MTAHPLSTDAFDLTRLIPQRHPARLRPWVVFAVVVVVAFFGLIFSRVALDRSGFELDDLESQIALEEAKRRDLSVEIARLQNPDRITEIALTNGLVYPDERIVIEVPGIDDRTFDPDYRWAQLKAVLTAQP